MNLEPEPFDDRNQLVIMGPALRTSPARAGQDIPAFWQRFMEEGWLARLPRPAEPAALYAVYCRYQGDHTQPYTMILGVAVDAAAPLPTGTERVVIPAGPKARFRAEGPPADVVWPLWQHVCERWPQRGRRSFVADYERYPLAALTPGHVQVEIVVGLA